MATINLFSGGGYRDATHGATLRALEERRKALEDALTRASQPTQVNHPLQGIAGLAETMSAGIREGRAANEATAGRQRLAELMAGGLTPDEYGEAMGLDPELTGKYIGHDWDVQGAKDRVQAEKDAADALAKREAVRDATKHGYDVTDTATKHGYETQDAAALAEVNRKQAEADRLAITNEAQRKEQAEPGVEAAKITAAVEARKAEALKLGMKEGSPEYNAYTTTGQQPTMASQPFAGPQGVKDLQEYKSGIAKIDNTMDDLAEAQTMLPNVVGGSFNRKMLDTAMAAGEAGHAGLLHTGWTEQQIQATQRFNQLMDSIATAKEAGTLKGALSDREMAKFMEIYNNPNSTPENKQRGLLQLMDSFKGDRQTLSEALRSGGYAAPEYTPRDRSGGGASGGGASGAGGEPVFDPAQDKEGDTGTNDDGSKWIVKGGKWVRQ
jgi:hypothetical protein